MKKILLKLIFPYRFRDLVLNFFIFWYIIVGLGYVWIEILKMPGVSDESFNIFMYCLISAMSLSYIVSFLMYNRLFKKR